MCCPWGLRRSGVGRCCSCCRVHLYTMCKACHTWCTPSPLAYNHRGRAGGGVPTKKIWGPLISSLEANPELVRVCICDVAFTLNLLRLNCCPSCHDTGRRDDPGGLQLGDGRRGLT